MIMKTRWRKGKEAAEGKGEVEERGGGGRGGGQAVESKGRRRGRGVWVEVKGGDVWGRGNYPPFTGWALPGTSMTGQFMK